MMGMMQFGRISAHIKSISMQVKWQERKKSGDLTSKKSDMEYHLEQWREQQKNRDYELESIYAKLHTGKPLTVQEMNYLEKKNPQMHQKAKAIEEERKGYEEGLKKCETKEEVEHLRLKHLSSIFSNVNSIMNNSAIPKGKKLELILQEKQRLEAINEATERFVRKGYYRDLPTEAERSEAEKQMEEDKNEHLDKLVEQSQMEEKPSEDFGTESNGHTENSEIQQSTVDGSDKPSKAEEEKAPEVRKLKKSKQKCLYLRTDDENYAYDILNQIRMNWNA